MNWGGKDLRNYIDVQHKILCGLTKKEPSGYQPPVGKLQPPPTASIPLSISIGHHPMWWGRKNICIGSEQFKVTFGNSYLLLCG